MRALISLAGEFRDIDLDRIRFVTMPNRIYDAPVGDPHWGRVEILPPAYRLMQLVDQDEPLGAFRKGSMAPVATPAKPPTEQAKAAAAAAGICA